MSFTFACYYPAEDPLFFVVEIKSSAWVAQLLNTIAVELRSRPRFCEVNVTDLRLFKTDVPLEPGDTLQSRALQWLYRQPADSQIIEMTKLSLFFPNGPHESDDNLKLDILVADAEVLESVEDLSHPDNAYKRKVKKALEERLNRLPLGPPPSEVVQNANKIAEMLDGNQPPIYLDRVPAVIYNTALATLQRRLDHLEEIPLSRLDIERAAQYIRCATTFYDNDAHRQSAISELIDEAIGADGDWGCTLRWADNIKPGGSWWHHEFPILILELKNTLGLSGDALLQATFGYSKIVSRKRYKPFREYCNFPVVLIGITANRLEIAVAVCVGPIYVTKLLTLDLSLGFHASDNITRLARVFSALSQCQEELKIYYDEITELSAPRLTCLFPSPTLLDPSKELPKLTYRQSLSRAGQPTPALVELGQSTTAMYIATLGDTNQEVIVKFTARYNKVAHDLLADAQLAPPLLFCQRVIGGLYMVVMDRADGKSIWQLRQDETPIPTIVLKKVAGAVAILHENNIVFGDLQDANILYVASDNSVALVDFDWPGKDGKRKYPPTLNPSNAWAEGVVPYGVMCKSHDLWHVKRLEGFCIRGA